MSYEKLWKDLKDFIEDKVEYYSNYQGSALRDGAVQCEVQCRAILRKMSELENSKNE